MGLVRRSFLFRHLCVCGASLASPMTFGQASSPSGPNLPDAPAAGAACRSRLRTRRREITWRGLPGEFLRDQKEDLVRISRPACSRPSLGSAGRRFRRHCGTGPCRQARMPYFRSHQGQWDDTNDVFDSYITTGEVVALPVGLPHGGLYPPRFPRSGYSASGDRRVRG